MEQSRCKSHSSSQGKRIHVKNNPTCGNEILHRSNALKLWDCDCEQFFLAGESREDKREDSPRYGTDASAIQNRQDSFPALLVAGRCTSQPKALP